MLSNRLLNRGCLHGSLVIDPTEVLGLPRTTGDDNDLVCEPWIKDRSYSHFHIKMLGCTAYVVRSIAGAVLVVVSAVIWGLSAEATKRTRRGKV